MPSAFALGLTGGKIAQTNGDGNTFGKELSLGRSKDSILVACFSITDSGIFEFNSWLACFFCDIFFVLHRTGVGLICPIY